MVARWWLVVVCVGGSVVRLFAGGCPVLARCVRWWLPVGGSVVRLFAGGCPLVARWFVCPLVVARWWLVVYRNVLEAIE